jgi:hypothetical protein
MLGLDLLIQLVPSLAEGLLYGVFVRQVQPERRLYCVRNKTEIVYASCSFQ